MNQVLQRYLVFSPNRRAQSCIVYAFNSFQAAEFARPTLYYLLGHNPRTVHVYSTHEDGSAKSLLTRYTY